MARTPFDTPGPTPGSKGAVSQHKAMASGYDLPVPARKVKTLQREKSTGCTYAPGLSNSKSKRKAK